MNIANVASKVVVAGTVVSLVCASTYYQHQLFGDIGSMLVIVAIGVVAYAAGKLMPKD